VRTIVASMLVALACHGPPVAAQGLMGGPESGGASQMVGPAAPNWRPARIEVFATTSTPIANAAGATIHRVDVHDRLVSELNAGGLPPDRDRAAAIVRRRIQAMGPAFHEQVRAALRAAEAMTAYGLRGVPAIVFDGSHVVSGITDVAQAIEVVRCGGGDPVRQRFVPASASDTSPSSAGTPRRPAS
jgi:integrating conjugative element protein (TIGR03757 family)